MKGSAEFINGRGAFTLIELLLVVSLIAFIGLGIYKVVSNTVSMWNWFLNHGDDNAVLVFSLRLQEDIDNAFNYNLNDFYGSASAMKFSSHSPQKFASGRPDKDGLDYDYMRRFYRIYYQFDREKEVIYRKVYDLAEREVVYKSRILKDVKSVTFVYYVYDNITGKTTKMTSFAGKLPRAVQVNVIAKRKDKSSGRPLEFSRIYYFPLG